MEPGLHSMRFTGTYGNVAEWLMAAVLKIADGNTSDGSNPSVLAQLFNMEG